MFLRCMVFVLLLVGGVGVYGQQAPSKPSQPPIVVMVTQPQQPWYQRPEWVNVFVTSGYVVIAAFTLFILWKQSRYMGVQTGRMARQADLMNRQTKIEMESLLIAKEAVNAAKESADAAKESADVAAAQTKAMTDRERARLYVDASPVKLIANLQVGERIAGFDLTIRNVAPTAAINVRGVYSAIATEMQTPPARHLKLQWESMRLWKGRAKWNRRFGFMRLSLRSQPRYVFGVMCGELSNTTTF